MFVGHLVRGKGCEVMLRIWRGVELVQGWPIAITDGVASSSPVSF